MSLSKEKVETLFDAAAALEAGPMRANFLDRECPDPELRREIELLLVAHDDPDSVFSQRTARAESTSAVGIGSVIGRYKLLENLGEGGFGSVWLAEQKEPVRRKVALKVIKLGMDTQQVVARFEAERQALAMMDHPNIAKVLDAGTTETGRPYFVMELVRGIPLTKFCDENRLATRERLELFIKVCHAVQHAHQKGIIHRDLKPSNVLVTLHDGVPVPKVIDFGIAKATQQELTNKTIHTQFQQFIGTPAYVSPEQAEMSGLDIDTRSDIYSLGVLLYELLTGSTPFDAKELMASGMDAMRKTIREKEPMRPSTRVATLDADELTTTAKRRSVDTMKLLHQVRGDLDWIVMKCLEKDRTRRYETSNAFAADLRRHLDNEPVIARPASAAYKFQKAFRRNRVGFAIAALIGCVLVTATGVSTWQAVRAKRAEVAARLRLEESEAVSQLLTDIFQNLDPYQNGHSLTVPELLRVTARRLETNLLSQPARRAALQAALGYTFAGLGLIQESIPLQEGVLAYHRTNSGPENPETLLAMSRLSGSYYISSRASEALKLQEALLPLSRKVNGPEHPVTLTVMRQLAGSLNVAGRYAESLSLREEVLALSRKVNGPEHSDTIRAMSWLVDSYTDVCRNEEARKLGEEVLSISRKALGPENPFTIASMWKLGAALSASGHLREALSLQEEALSIARKALGPEHNINGLIMADLADSYEEAGRTNAALKMREAAASIFQKNIGPEDLSTIGCRMDVSKSYRAVGRVEQAIRLGEEVLALSQKVDAAVRPYWMHRFKAEQGVTYRRVGRLEEAITLGEASVAFLRTTPGTTNRITLAAMTQLAISYQAAHRFRDAIVLAEETLPLQRRHLAPGAIQTLESLDNLATCYEQTRRNAEAEALRREIIELKARAEAQHLRNDPGSPGIPTP